jgi:hypothetical protein
MTEHIIQAPKGGATGVDGAYRLGGEFEPFYVPRPLMPQVDEDCYFELLQYVQQHGHAWSYAEVDPSTLQPHQRIDHDRARHMDPLCLKKPVLVAQDGYILDGNHRWWEHNHLGLPIRTISIDLPFAAAIEFLFSFPKTYSYGDGAEHKEGF